MLQHKRIRVAGMATALVLSVLAAPSVAGANVAPNPVGSSVTCAPAPPSTTLRAGDDVLCRLRLSFSDLTSGVTADVTIPATTSFDPSAPENGNATPDDPLAPTKISYGVLTLGTFFPGDSKTVTFRLKIKQGALAGAPIDPTATVQVPTLADTVLPAPTTTVMPDPPDLSPSAMSCAKDGPPPLRPGDAVICTISLADLANHEAAKDVAVQTTLPPSLTWLAGGSETSHTGTQILNWDASALPGGVPVLPARPGDLTFRAQVAPNVQGGSQILVTAQVLYKGLQSGDPGSQLLAAPPLQLALTEATLLGSTLRCADVDGPPLYSGDLIKCTLAATDPIGHEDIDQLTGTAPVPANTTVTQGKLGNDGQLTFGTEELGSVAAAGTKSTFYTLRVNPGTPASTAITPRATLRGRSVLSGNPIEAAVVAPPLVVSDRPAPVTSQDDPVVTVPIPAAQSAAQSGQKKPPATTPAKCTTKKTVTVSVKPPKGKKWKSVTFTFAGKTVKGKRGKKGAFTGKLVFDKLPKGTVKVSIVGKTTKGKTVRSSRSYAAC